jgi:hypothetical protein
MCSSTLPEPRPIGTARSIAVTWRTLLHRACAQVMRSWLTHTNGWRRRLSHLRRRLVRPGKVAALATPGTYPGCATMDEWRYPRILREIPIEEARCCVAPADRLSARAIFLTPIFLRARALTSRISCFVHLSSFRQRTQADVPTSPKGTRRGLTASHAAGCSRWRRR